MRAENHPAPGQAACQGTASPAPQRSFGLLARRISAWTTNGLLTVIILVVGLVFGRQVLRWWAADAPRSNAASATPRIGQGLGDPSQPHVLQFGNQPWSLRQQVIGGDRQAAAAALLADCRRFLQSAPAPAGAAGSDRAARARNAEVLATLRQLKPTEEERGKWRLYQLPNDLPMVAGVRQDAAATQGRAASKLAEGTPAVVIWGLAIPRARQAWTLYTFQPESDAGQPNSGLASIPIPPGSCRIMAMQVAEGGGIAAFSGPDRTEQWKQFYDDWFVKHRWKPSGGWQQMGSSWHVRYTAADRRQPAAAEIRLSPDRQGRCTGLVMVSPGSF